MNDQELKTLEVTRVEIEITEHLAAFGKNSKAFARVVLNDQLQLTRLRVVQGADGLFVAYPNDPTFKGEDYRSIFFPLKRDLREHIETEVLKQYEIDKKS